VVNGVGGGDLEVLVAAGAQHGLVDAALSGLQVGGGKGGGVAGGGAALDWGAEFLEVGLDRSGPGCIEARNGCWADQKSFDDGLNLLGSARSSWADSNTRTAAVAKSTHAEHTAAIRSELVGETATDDVEGGANGGEEAATIAARAARCWPLRCLSR
jgi:hypothetical protein